MNSFRSIFFKNLSLINLLTVLIFFIYSIIIIRYQYDGHHIGLIYSNSIDLLNGKLPYKEIFIQYGILTTIINSIILSIFDTKIFFISFFNSIFYFLGVLFISKTVNNFTNLKLSFLATVIILPMQKVTKTLQIQHLEIQMQQVTLIILDMIFY